MNIKKLVILPVILMVACFSLYAEETGGKVDIKTKKVAAISQKVFLKMTEAQELIEANKYKEGLAVMDTIKATEKDLSEYEKAQMWNIYGYTYFLQEEYIESIKAYEKLVLLPDVPAGLISSSLNTLSQLYFTTGDYKKAIDAALEVKQYVDEPSTTIYLIIGQSYYQLEQYDRAIEPIKQAIGLNAAKGINPEENWLLLLRAIYFELNDHENLVRILKELIQVYSKEEYLRTLAGVYNQRNNTKKQLAIMESLYEQGYINTEKDILNIINLYLLEGLPYKAAIVMDKGLKENSLTTDLGNIKLLAQAWNQAREYEKALAPLSKAADLSNDGNLYVRLGQAYINLAQWDNAIRVLQLALEKKNTIRVDTVNIMLGMAYFNNKQLGPAKVAFETASHDKRSQEIASKWITYVESEQQREELMQKKTL